MASSSKNLSSVIEKFVKEKHGSMTPEQFARFVRHELPIRAREVLNGVQRKVALDIYAQVLNRWPVDTGWSRANWQVAVDSAPRKIVPSPGLQRQSPQPATPEDLSRGLSGMRMDPLSVNRVIWISNPLPYARVIEFGLYPPGPKTVGGFSRQAPKGAARLAIQSVLGRGALKAA